MKRRQLEIPKDKRPKQMIVIDDSVGLIERNSSINYLGTRYRHYNCNMIMSVQSFRACSPIMRTNANCVILMNGIMNAKEMEKILDEYNDIYKGTLGYCYRKYANKKYDFIFMKVRENPPQMFHGFHTEINWKQHRKEARSFKIEEDFTDEEEDSE
jgi:hypothetical protein